MPRISDQDRAVRRQRIVDAAWRRLATNGYHETTIDDVCDEAGVSKGAFYGYFDTKQALFLALLEEETEALNSVARELAEQELPVQSGFAGSYKPCWRSVTIPVGCSCAPTCGRSSRVIRSCAPRSPRRSSGAERCCANGSPEHRSRRPRHRAAPRECAASILIAMADGLMLHRALDPQGFRWSNIRAVMDALIAGIDRTRRHDPTGRGGRAATLAVPGDARRRALLWLHGSAPGLMALGVVVGIGAGLGAVAFRELILAATRLFTGHSDYSAAGHVANPHLPSLGIWFVVAAPVIGGLIYGPLIARFANEAKGHGVPEVMLAVSRQGGRISPRGRRQGAGIRLCIGSGGSVGREGPIVQIGSALGSGLGQLLRMPAPRLRLLVACGAAGGISATFNAPIAGVFFALELILRDFEAESFGVVVFSSVTADVIGRAAFGSQPFLHCRLPPALARGVRPLRGARPRRRPGRHRIRARALRDGGSSRPHLARAAVASTSRRRRPPRLLLFVLPQLYGVGYPVLKHAVGGGYARGS